LLLAGEGQPIVNVAILTEVVEAWRERKAQQQDQLQAAIRARLNIEAHNET
jgi:hypothetical protein